MTISLLSLDF